MEAFLFIFLIWIVPAWFSIRINLVDSFNCKFDAFDIIMIFLVIPFTSWFGLLLMAILSDGDDVKKAFFIPVRDERSLKSQIFWYKVRKAFFMLFLIKESK